MPDPLYDAAQSRQMDYDDYREARARFEPVDFERETMRDPADIALKEHLAAEAECEVRQIAAELGRPRCDVRWLDGAESAEVYMAGGVWLPVAMVREMKAEAAP